ncbi:MAG: molybdopterin cofactor-binding domain-containing protein, partial [Pseudomonadales bacterium]
MGKWTRRGFIVAGVGVGGALVVGVALRPGNRLAELSPMVAGDGETLVNSFVKVGADNRVTVIVPHAEMGQGVHTSLTQMLADEMDAAWSQVAMELAPAEPEFANYSLGKGYILGDADVPAALLPTLDGAFIKIAQAMNLQITGGSTSVQATGVYGMRVAGAAARQMLLDAASEQWSVPAVELVAKEGMILHAGSGRTEPFARFVELAATLTPPVKPKLKTTAEFTLMGRS